MSGSPGMSFAFRSIFRRCPTKLRTSSYNLSSGAVAYETRGEAYALKREYDQAIADCTEAIRLKPIRGEPYYIRGRAFQEQGEEEKAEADFASGRVLGADSAVWYRFA